MGVGHADWDRKYENQIFTTQKNLFQDKVIMSLGCTLSHSTTSYSFGPGRTTFTSGVPEDKGLLGMHLHAPETMTDSGSKRSDGKGTEGNKATKEIKSKELQRQ